MPAAQEKQYDSGDDERNSDSEPPKKASLFWLLGYEISILA